MELKQFHTIDLPPYAILSHVWEDEEISFQELTSEGAKLMKGYWKITAACATAAKDGLQYIWIDTCCINKESSAELSEAINSMFLWYGNSRICYAYLADVPSDEDPTSPLSSFVLSKWFTRGWTLQELLAPNKVVFCGRDWINIGTKGSLRDAISVITGIKPEAIVGGRSFVFDDIPVAVRMSWAADRHTTRVEDVAYCLMGIFDVNLPLMYGEGRKAFVRLQQLIIQKSNDHSIFAWREEPFSKETERGILARSPSEFHDSNTVQRVFEPEAQNKTYSITNRGLHIELPLVYHSRDIQLARLNCRQFNSATSVTIVLRKTDGNQYARVCAHLFGDEFWKELDKSTLTAAELSPLFIKEDVGENPLDYSMRSTVARIVISPKFGLLECQDSYSDSPRPWQIPTEGEWVFVGSAAHIGVLLFRKPFGRAPLEQFALVLGYKDCMMWTDIVTNINPKDTALSIYRSYRPLLGEKQTRTHRYLDRSSAALPNASGWSVFVSSGTLQTRLDGERVNLDIQVRKTKTQLRSGLQWKRPVGSQVYLVTVPAPHHGFTVVAENLQVAHSYYGKWVQYNNSYILCIPIGSFGASVVRFRKTLGDTKIEFFFVIGLELWGVKGRLMTCIEGDKPENPKLALTDKGKVDTSYNTRVEGAGLVFVSIRRCRDASMADFIVDVSM
jgi:hypothetical protein